MGHQSEAWRIGLSVVLIGGVILLAFLGMRMHLFSSAITKIQALTLHAADNTRQVVSTATDHSESRSHTHPLLRVIDGDTIVVLHGALETTVRLIGIDAPETGKGNRARECFGDEATVHLTKLLKGSPVSLIPDDSQGLYDKYGRALMYVEQNGVDMNAQMIADGYAHEYTYNKAYEHQISYKSLEKTAQEAHLGLWANRACATTSQ